MDKPNQAQQQMDEIRNQMVLMETRQTSNDYETAEEKLKEKNYNYELVIKEFMGVKPKEEVAANTKNQEVYRQIRNMMDEGDRQYRVRKDYQEKVEKVMEYRRQLYEQQKAKKM